MKKYFTAGFIALIAVAFQNCGLQSPDMNSPIPGTNSSTSSSTSSSSSSDLGPIPDGTSLITPSPTTTPVQAKDVTYNTAGTTTMSVPQYNTITVKIWGAGGGGGSEQAAGTTGGDSAVTTTKGILRAGAGKGGGQCVSTSIFVPVTINGGAGGVASGDGMNVTGNAGKTPTTLSSGFTITYLGGVGGIPLKSTLAAATGSASALGGGGGGSKGSSSTLIGGGGGGSGAYVERVYVYPELPVGSNLQITVGAGGKGGPSYTALITKPAGGDGAVGQVQISIR